MIVSVPVRNQVFVIVWTMTYVCSTDPLGVIRTAALASIISCPLEKGKVLASLVLFITLCK